MNPSAHAALSEVIAQVRGEPLVILLTGHPDPDALGSALAHQRICESLGVHATIAHVLTVSHRQNRALVKLLNIDMVQVEDGSELRGYKYLSLVDTSTPEPSIELPADLKLLTVVDHHRAARPEAPFVDIRTSMGSSSAIYAQYLEAGLAPLTGQRREDAAVATALLFGIQTDTDDFALATPADFAAAAYVKTYADLDVLKRIGRRTVSAAAMNVLARALADLHVVRDFAIAGVGSVAAGDRDTIGSAADFIMQREDIDTALVFGLVGDRIDGSIRTSSASLDPAAFLLTAFGRDPSGRPYGGGRADKGGFQIPLGMLGEAEDREGLWRIAEAIVHARLSTVVPELEDDTPVRRNGARRSLPDDG